MDYKVDFGIWGSIFPVPTAIADQHLKLCSESQLKVLLLALRDAPNPVDVQYIAKRLGLTPSQVSDGLDYWQQAGVFTHNEPEQAVQPAAPDGKQTGAAASGGNSGQVEIRQGADGQVITTIHSRGKLTPSQINQISITDPKVPWLLEELQHILARPLSPSECETIVYLYTYLEVTPDYLLMVVKYCKSIGKSNMRYIEKLVTGWVDQGVDTHDKAERHILELNRRSSNEGLIKNLFGINDRELSAKEKQFINIWLDQYGYDAGIIKLAYERTVDNTGRVAFPYINKILTQWNREGIRTPQEAQQQIAAGSQAVKNSASPSFDIGEIERIMQQNSN